MQKITAIVRPLIMLEEKDFWKLWWFEQKNGLKILRIQELVPMAIADRNKSQQHSRIICTFSEAYIRRD